MTTMTQAMLDGVCSRLGHIVTVTSSSTAPPIVRTGRYVCQRCSRLVEFKWLQ